MSTRVVQLGFRGLVVLFLGFFAPGDVPAARAEEASDRIACLKMRASEIETVLELESKNSDARTIISAYQEHQRRGRGLFKDLPKLDQLNLEINELQRRAADLHREIDSLRTAGLCPE